METARTHEASVADDLLARVRELKFQPETATLDKGYDTQPVHDACHEHGVLPMIPLTQTDEVALPARRPVQGQQLELLTCSPAFVWIKADRLHPLVPRETKRWGDLYRGRSAVEREFGRLKHEYGLTPLRVRDLDRVALHADLTMLARLAQALGRARAVPLAA